MILGDKTTQATSKEEMTVNLADQLTIRLTPAERAELEAVAREQDRSIGFVVREGVRLLLAQKREHKPEMAA